MRNWYRQLKIEYKVAFWSTILVLGIAVLLIPLFFLKLMEIPQGILVGGGISIVVYLFLGLFNNPDKPKKSLVATIVVIALRLVIIAGLLFLDGWLYYSLGFKAFNIFAIAASYLLPLIVHVFLGRKES